LANVLSVALLIYLTYFFTLSFSTRPPAPAPVPESARVAAKKIEELRAEDRQLLTTYGPVNPATKSVRIPIDRAMDLIVAESNQPAPTPTPAAPQTPEPAPATPKAGATTAAPKAETALATPKAGTALATPKAGTTTATPKAGTTTAAPKAETTVSTPPPPPPPPARVGWTPVQLYRAICIACHDVDGRGTLVRLAMPTIPDLTDSKWQATRTDADLLNSVLEGKGQFMLSMKDKFALAKIDPKEMVAFMRSFQPGKPAVAPTTTPTQTPAPSAPGQVIASGPTAPAAPSPLVPPGSPATPPPAGPSAAALALANASPSPDLNLLLNPTPTPVPLSATFWSARTLSTPTSPERAAKLRVAGEFYSVNCVACHGPDGRGSAMRVAMPVIPDFTNREWQTSRENPQLAISILEGKGVLMIPWRGKVDPSIVQDLVAFIRGFGPAGLVAANIPTSEFGSRFRQLQQQWQALDQQARALARP